MEVIPIVFFFLFFFADDKALVMDAEVALFNDRLRQSLCSEEVGGECS